MLDGLHEICRSQKIIGGAGIQPAEAAAEQLDLQLAGFKIHLVDRGDFQLAPRGRGDPLGQPASVCPGSVSGRAGQLALCGGRFEASAQAGRAGNRAEQQGIEPIIARPKIQFQHGCRLGKIQRGRIDVEDGSAAHVGQIGQDRLIVAVFDKVGTFAGDFIRRCVADGLDVEAKGEPCLDKGAAGWRVYPEGDGGLNTRHIENIRPVRAHDVEAAAAYPAPVGAILRAAYPGDKAMFLRQSHQSAWSQDLPVTRAKAAILIEDNVAGLAGVHRPQDSPGLPRPSALPLAAKPRQDCPFPHA